MGDAFFQGYKGIGNAHAVSIVQGAHRCDLRRPGRSCGGGLPVWVGVEIPEVSARPKVLHTDAVGLFYDPIQTLQRDLIAKGRTEHAGQGQLDANIAGLLGSQLLN